MYRVINQHGEVIEATYIIVTVPVTVLRDEDIQFIPELPIQKSLAVKEIGMHSASKVMLRCKRKFWKQNVGVVFAAGMFIQQIWFNISSQYEKDGFENGNETETGRDNEVVVVGYASGDIAIQLYDLSTDEIVQKFIAQLDEMFG